MGAKFAVGERFSVGFEVCVRHLFTDYLDDVSTTYIDKNILLAERGAEAAELAFRANERNPALQYPAAGTPRGNPSQNDAYYTLLLRFTYRFGGGGEGFIFHNKKSMACPKNVL
jgi:hypothetical protein